MTKKIPKGKFQEHFWSKVNKLEGDDACWSWEGQPSANGYGQIRRDGKLYLAHRVAHELAIGPILEEEVVRQTCKNRLCCQPAHLVAEDRWGTLKERFWANVDIDTDAGPDACWTWTACVDKDGYGQIGRDGKLEKAHRVAWGLVNGEIPDGKQILHSCDNPPCCNPAHLFPGTHADNVADKVAKGRQAHVRGEATGNFKLTEELVRELRERRASDEKVADLAKEKGLPKSTIYAATSTTAAYRTWTHIEYS